MAPRSVKTLRRKRWVCPDHGDMKIVRTLDPDTSWAAVYMKVCGVCGREDLVRVKRMSVKPPLVSFPRWHAWRVERWWRKELTKIIDQAEAEGWTSQQILAANRKLFYRKRQRLGVA